MVTLAGSSTMVGMPTPVVFSWSAGKDSAYGLWTLLGDPVFEVRALLTTLIEGYNRVSMSGVRDELLDRQADALGLPMIKVWIPPQVRTRCTKNGWARRSPPPSSGASSMAHSTICSWKMSEPTVSAVF